MNLKFFSTIISHNEKEKSKDYRNVVLIQMLIIISGLVLSTFTNFATPAGKDKLVITLFSSFGVIYAFLLWDLLKDFTKSRVLVRGVLVILVFITILGFLGEFPYYKILNITDRRAYLLLIHGLLFPIEVIIIGFAIRDLFSGNQFNTGKLWGAACVYLMIGISFGSLYDLINIIRPDSFGMVLTMGLESYSESIYYSFNILGGLDTAYPNPTKLIRNIGVVEAVWANLYAILIIGKLLGLPIVKDSQGKKPI
jgi:hypothetical protein